MADICYTDAAHADMGVLSGASLDVEWGDDGNNFELTLDAADPARLAYGAYVYVEGTEWGGTVDELEADSGEGTVRYRGRSWHGILADRVICPDAGQAYLTVKGDATAVLGSLISRFGLGEVFRTAATASGIAVSYTFDRYADGYTGIRKMLKSAGARLAISYDSVAGIAVLSAVAAEDLSDGPDSDVADVDITEVARPYNHLVCLGKGELADRTVVHLYADARGNVSRTQSLFGLDERAVVYDYSNAEADELVKQGTEKLEGYQTASTIEVTLDDSGEYAVGDTVPGTDVATGTTVLAEVVSKIVKVSHGEATVSYKAGGAYRARSSRSVLPSR